MLYCYALLPLLLVSGYGQVALDLGSVAVAEAAVVSSGIVGGS